MNRLAALSVCLFSLPAFSQTLPGISDKVLQQIRDILDYKHQLTPAERKIEFSVLFTAKAARGELKGRSFEDIPPAIRADAAGNVVVLVKGSVPEIVGLVAASGGRVLAEHPRYGVVRARLPLAGLERMAESPAVKSISRDEVAIHHVGALTTQGYVSHGANKVGALNVTGAGVKVGVISDSASAAGLAALIKSGDLGANTTVLPGMEGPSLAEGGTDEGLALAEIVQDMAPGAQLFFADDGTTQFDMADHVTALAAAGCDIIFDDTSFLDEAAFQDGPVAQAVDTFVQNGGLYLSAAGNDGNLAAGTSGVWEGNFRGLPLGYPFNGEVQLFSPPDNSSFLDSIIQPGTASQVTLQWAEPLGNAGTDYSLVLVDSTGTYIKSIGTNLPHDSSDPIVAVGPAAAGDQLLVLLATGTSGPFLRIDTLGGKLTIATAGSTFGHNAAASAITIAATHWDSARTGTQLLMGGYSNPIETFSSDGPRRIFFNPDGTPAGIGSQVNNPKIVPKPDLTAADGVSVKTPGFEPFGGTSAAVAHVAGIAALVKSANPKLTNTQIRTILQSAALGGFATNINQGYGVVMALKAVQAALSQ